MRGGRARVVATACLVLALSLFVIGLLTLDPRSHAMHVFVDLGWTAFGVAASVTSIVVAVRTTEPGRRRAWYAFAAGATSWALGILQWTWLELVADVVTPFPAIGDIGYLATPVCFALGLLLYGSDAPGVKATLKQLGDLGIVLSTMGLTFGFVFGDAIEHGGTSALYRVIAIAYPVLHSTALTFAMMVFWSRTWHRQSLRVVAYIFASLLSHTVVNTYYAQSLLLARYEAGHVMDPAWCLASTFVVLAGVEELCREKGHVEERIRVSMGDSVITSLCIVVVSVTGTLEGFHATTTAPILGVMGVLLAVSLGVRNLGQRHIEEALRDEVRARDRQFVEAQKMKAVATLAGGLAHDFNNLLTGVLGGVSMLRRSAPRDPNEVAYLDLVEKSAERAADLTRRLLVFAHRRETELSVCRPRDILGRAATLVRSAAPANIVVHEDGGDRELVVRADASQIEHALVNLGLNAVHAMPHGGRLGFAVAVERHDEGRFVVFSVSDTGVGIPDDVRAHIFEPFYSTRAPGEGTGLGLAMVRSAVLAHEGHIELDSVVGAGTTFRLLVPLVEGAALETPVVEPEESAPGYETILVVDDRSAALLATQATLEADGYRVLSCARGAEALDIVEAEATIDLLVVDLGLPDMDGLELAARVRSRLPSLPVVLMTGQRTPAELPRFVVGVVEKPYRARALTSAVRRALDDVDVPVRDAV